MPEVKPEILVFARESAGLTLNDAARKLSIKNPDRLAALERGEREPSRTQLINMSKAYHRPLLTFYLSKPPKKSDVGQDFRTLPVGQEQEDQGNLSALLRVVNIRHRMIRGVLEEIEEDAVVPVVGSIWVNDPIEVVVARISKFLDFAVDDFRVERTIEKAFSALRTAVEKTGVYVQLMGDLGSSHSKISAKVFRGFALSDDIAPLIVINDNDSKAAWSFTLLHELVHVMLGETGTSGYASELEIERFCDKVASRFLLAPRELLQTYPRDQLRVPEIVDWIGNFAGIRNLSRKMVAFNLLQNQLISGPVFGEIEEILDAERLALKERLAKQKGAVDYYVVRRHRIGAKLVDLVKRSVAEGILTTTKAGRVLGVKPTAVHRMVDNGRQG